MKRHAQEKDKGQQGKHEGRQAAAAAEQQQPSADPEPEPKKGKQRPARQT